MSLDVNGFTNDMNGGEIVIKIDSNHRLLKLARQLPWDEMLEVVLPDLQVIERARWWMGGHCESEFIWALTFYNRCLI